MKMDDQKKTYILDIMAHLEWQMRLVAVEMMESGHDELMQHGDELIGAAVIVQSWIEGFRCEVGE